jgi:tetratricopeptide (TPR) repeat protein
MKAVLDSWDELISEPVVKLARLLRVQALIELDRGEEAILRMREWVDIDEPGRLGLLLAQALLVRQEPIEALSWARRTAEHAELRSDLLAWTHVAQGRALSQLDDPKAAVEEFRTALAIKPEHARVWWEQGLVQSQLGRHLAANASLTRAWELGERTSSVAAARSAALIHLERYDDAVTFLESARSVLDGSTDATATSNALYNWAVAYYRLGDPGAAYDRLDGVRSTQAYDLRLNLANARHSRGQWIDFWFGEGVPTRRRIAGTVLVAIVVLTVMLPILDSIDGKGLDWVSLSAPWQVALAPLISAVVILVLPSLQSVKFASLEVHTAQPTPTSIATDPLAGASDLMRAISEEFDELFDQISVHAPVIFGAMPQAAETTPTPEDLGSNTVAQPL